MEEQNRRSGAEDLRKTVGTGGRMIHWALKRKKARKKLLFGKISPLMKIKIIGIFLGLLVIETLLFGVPAAIYETIQGYFGKMGTVWQEDYFKSEQDRIGAFWEATLKGTRNIQNDAWINFLKLINQDEKDPQTGLSELLVVGETEAAREAYRAKIDAVIFKVTQRQDEIWNILQSSARKGAIQSAFYSMFLEERRKLSALPSTHNVTFDGVRLEHVSSQPTVRDAVKLIALYSALYNQDFQLVEPRSLLEWLGYKNTGLLHLQSDSFALPLTESEKLYLNIDHWSGTFLPSYAMTEYVYTPSPTVFIGDTWNPSLIQTMTEEYVASRQTALEEKQCAAVDYLLSVSAFPIRSIAPNIDRKSVPIPHEKSETTWKWELLTLDEVRSRGFDEKKLETKPVVNPRKQEYRWYLIPYTRTWTEYEYKYDYVISYHYSISVSVRSAEDLIRLTSFYEKESLEETSLEEDTPEEESAEEEVEDE